MKAKSKNNVICIDDFFSTTKDYYLYAVRSPYALMRMAAQLQTCLRSNFSYIGDYQLTDNPVSPLFPIFYTRLAGGDPIDFFLIENKTLRYDKEALPLLPDKEQTSFSATLFEEEYYLFNAGRYYVYKWNLVDIPFLFLFSVAKDTEVVSLTNQLSILSQVQTYDRSSLLSGRSKSSAAIKKMFCTLDTMAMAAQKVCSSKYLSGSHALPDTVNRRYANIPLNVKFNEQYIRLLKDDQTFERSFVNKSY